MSDIMRPIPFSKIMKWVLEEKKSQNTVFGVHKAYKADKKILSIFGENIETPFGPAAGPNTQLAQNIIASYYAGSRFFELKTVQVIDGEDLPVSKPCILAEDECYNVEWSTELLVSQAMDEYIKAWFALKILSKEFSLGDTDGFIFNMSVGYDLEGIKTQKVNSFIEGLKNSENTKIFKECKKWAIDNIDLFSKVDVDFINSISAKVSNSITLSTLHGCPPDEIERIAKYLITEKRLNTFIKCNPTLLGYEFARKTMDEMGYDYISFDDHHFLDDLQYEDAVPMIERLMKLSKENNLEFGVKLTNTFPVKICSNELPGDEMYMSGRSLFPLSISLAAKLSETFNGKLRISFSGGADAFNIDEIFNLGIWPITIATTILKPGGYDRLNQLAEILHSCEYKDFLGVNTKGTKKLACNCIKDIHHTKPIKKAPTRKLQKKVPLTNCFTSPCSHGCPIGQDIPQYINLAGSGKYLEALKVITSKNPLPFITGTICPHRCTSKCTRNFYEESIKIREVKLLSAQNAFNELKSEIKKSNKSAGKVAIIGGGPAGIAAAYFLLLENMDVTIFEQKENLGGIVRYIIPAFRIEDKAIDNDVELIKIMGANIVTNTRVESADELKDQGFKYIIFATGAWNPINLEIPGIEPTEVFDFLAEFKANNGKLNLGKNVIVIGGGNTAMDAARAAKRVPGVEKVSLVYRRDRRNMPADEEELQYALDDDVIFEALRAPVKYENGNLICQKMILGEPDSSGRRSPVATDETQNYKADTVISSIGERVDSEFFKNNGLVLNKWNQVQTNDELKTNINNIFVIGDALGGPATVVEAIADATKVCSAILSKEINTDLSSNGIHSEAIDKKGILKMADKPACEKERCLECDTVCECCVDVCPNRANVVIDVDFSSMPQILHIDAMCNECGNCKVFCPYDSAPYKEKFTLFACKEDFDNSENEGFIIIDDDKYIVRLDGKIIEDEKDIPFAIFSIIDSVMKNYSYYL